MLQFKPLLEKRLQLAHVLEGEVESFKPRYCRRGEVFTGHATDGQAHFALSETQFDSLLLQLLGKVPQLLQFNVVMGRRVKIGQGIIGTVTREEWRMVEQLRDRVSIVERLEWGRAEGVVEGEE